eukprot:g6473.t1
MSSRPRWKLPSTFADDLAPRSRSASSLPPMTTNTYSPKVQPESASPSKTIIKETVTIKSSTELADLIERSLPLLRNGGLMLKNTVSPQMKELLRSFTGESLDEKLAMPLCLLVAAIEEAKKPPVAEQKTPIIPLPTRPMADWEDLEDIIAPRDLVRNGTWVGITQTGRLSFLTNYLQCERKRITHSRGDLPVLFLTSTEKPLPFLKRLNLDGYGMVNLITAQVVGDIEVAFRSSAREQDVERLPAGVHGFSNGFKDDLKWEKVVIGKQKMEKLISELEDGADLPWDEIFDDILGRTTETDSVNNLPGTGFPEVFKRRISAMKILPFWNFCGQIGLCGTTSQIVIAVWKDGLVQMKERIWTENCESFEHGHQFYMNKESV